MIDNLPKWLESGIDELVLVDWGCPGHCTHAVYQQGSIFRHPKLTIVKVSEKITGPFFSLGRARNLGARVAKHEIVMMMDADCYAEKRHVRDIRKAVRPWDCPLAYPAFDGFRHPYSSQFACDKSFYYCLGGMSEAIDWWSDGEESRSFVERVPLYSGVNRDHPVVETAAVDTACLHNEPHGDEDRLRFSRIAVDRYALEILREHTRDVLSHGVVALGNGVVNSGRGCGTEDMRKSRLFRAGSEVSLSAVED